MTIRRETALTHQLLKGGVRSSHEKKKKRKKREMREKNVETKGFIGRLFDAQKERDVERWYSFTEEQKNLVYRYTILVFLFGVLGGMSGGAFLWL